MVAGATGIDVALLVIAADDGVMPQTREHLAILQLLGVDRGAVALTKIDRVDAARQARLEIEIAALLAGTPLQDSLYSPATAPHPTMLASTHCVPSCMPGPQPMPARGRPGCAANCSACRWTACSRWPATARW